MAEFKHVTVLLKEAVAGLNVQPTGTYVDATLGGGGHTQAILQQLVDGHLYSFDQDQTLPSLFLVVLRKVNLLFYY